MPKTVKAYLIAGFGNRMKYWSNHKIEREHVFASVGPNSSTEEKAWREALDIEIKRRNLKL